MYKLIRPLIFLQDPEKAHERVVTFGKILGDYEFTDFIKPFFNYKHPSLETEVAGMKFINPIGLAAGFDKNAVLMPFIEALGFGFEEIGSVTARGGDGNPKPRLFRLCQDEAIINRMGLNGEGVRRIKLNLDRYEYKIPVGINIAKTHSSDIMGEKAIADFLETYKLIGNIGKFNVLNISCPNTLEGKTFEDSGALRELLFEINEWRYNNSLFVKISPDCEEKNLYSLLEICENFKISGYVVSNTSLKRDGLNTSNEQIDRIGKGGLSGRPIRDVNTQMIKRVYNKTKKPIIGVGGVFNAEDAYEKITAGASLIEIYTGMIYEGPSVVKKINKGLVKIMEREGYNNIGEMVGIAV